MAKVGRQAQGQRGHKVWVVRHGHGPRRGCNAAEKAIETKVRRLGKQDIDRQMENFRRFGWTS